MGSKKKMVMIRDLPDHPGIFRVSVDSALPIIEGIRTVQEFPVQCLKCGQRYTGPGKVDLNAERCQSCKKRQ